MKTSGAAACLITLGLSRGKSWLLRLVNVLSMRNKRVAIETAYFKFLSYFC